MNPRLTLGIALALIALFSIATFGAGLIIAPLALAIVSRDVRESVLVREPGRARLAATAALVALAGFLLFRVLVFDSNDNAYLEVGILGIFMVPVAVAFGLAAVIPVRRLRRGMALFAVCLLWGVCLVAILVMTLSVAIIPGQNYPNNDVLTSHILALGISLVLIGWALIAYSRIGDRGFSHGADG